jgi:hypothetical protein
MRRYKQFWLSAFRWFLVLWFALTLPMVTVLTINAWSRSVLLETLAHWRSKVVPLKYVFVGDSIIAGGRNWGWRLWDNPLVARNLAGNGYTVWQIEGQVREAWIKRNCVIFCARTGPEKLTTLFQRVRS